MFILFRRLFKQLLLTAVIGYAIRKAMGSDNPRVKSAGQQANRLLGGFIGLDETGRRVPRGRRMRRSAGSALLGGAVSYFMDPQQGAERRARAKAFASERMRRNGQQLALPRGSYEVPPAGTPTSAPTAATG